MKRRRPEAQLQSCVMRHYRLRGAPDAVLFAVPNGGFRHRIEAARLKAQGVTAGIPDLIGIRDGRVYGFELKAEGGRLSPAQRDMAERLRRSGAIVTTCHGLDAALHALEVNGFLRGHAS
jgi:hypothetical protein